LFTTVDFYSYLVRNELNAQLETYENKLSTSTKLAEEYKRENAKIVRLYLINEKKIFVF